MIRIDAIWLATEPMDMRAGTDTALARVVAVFGATVNEQLAHEIALLKRHKFAKRSEQLSPAQGSLLEDLIDTDIAAIEAELEAVTPPVAPAEPRLKPKRAPLPPQFPRTVSRVLGNSHARFLGGWTWVTASDYPTIRSGHGRWVARTGCSPGRYAAVNGRRRP